MSRKYLRYDRCSHCQAMGQTAKTQAFGVVCVSCNERLRRDGRRERIGSHGKVGKYWTDERNALLTAIYHSATAAECERAFPGRTLNALYQQARLLGIHQKGVRIHRERSSDTRQTPPDRRESPAQRVASYRIAPQDLAAIREAEHRLIDCVRSKRGRTQH